MPAPIQSYQHHVAPLQKAPKRSSALLQDAANGNPQRLRRQQAPAVIQALARRLTSLCLGSFCISTPLWLRVRFVYDVANHLADAVVQQQAAEYD